MFAHPVTVGKSLESNSIADKTTYVVGIQKYCTVILLPLIAIPKILLTQVEIFRDIAEEQVDSC